MPIQALCTNTVEKQAFNNKCRTFYARWRCRTILYPFRPFRAYHFWDVFPPGRKGLINSNLLDRFSKKKKLKYRISLKSVQWEPRCSARTGRQTGRNDEANCRLSQFPKYASNLNAKQPSHYSCLSSHYTTIMNSKCIKCTLHQNHRRLLQLLHNCNTKSSSFPASRSHYVPSLLLSLRGTEQQRQAAEGYGL
jgi:hypothetical protein